MADYMKLNALDFGYDDELISPGLESHFWDTDTEDDDHDGAAGDA